MDLIAKAPDSTCRHCRINHASAVRVGLCFRCYFTPKIRAKYSSGQTFGNGGNNANLGLPAVPTLAPPGSIEKMRVLEQRAKGNVALWHPLDARWPGDPRTLAALSELAAKAA